MSWKIGPIRQDAQLCRPTVFAQMLLVLKSVTLLQECLFSFIDGATLLHSDVDMEQESHESGAESKEGKHKEPGDGNNIVNGYNPKLALKHAIEDWIPEFYQPKESSNCFTVVTKQLTDSFCKESNEHSHSNISKQSMSNSEVQTDKKEDSSETKKSSKQSSKKDLAETKDSGKHKIEEPEPLSHQDVQTMCDLFYLLFQHGSHGVYLLKEVHWLVQQAGQVKDCYKIPQSEQVNV